MRVRFVLPVFALLAPLPASAVDECATVVLLPGTPSQRGVLSCAPSPGMTCAGQEVAPVLLVEVCLPRPPRST